MLQLLLLLDYVAILRK